MADSSRDVVGVTVAPLIGLAGCPVGTEHPKFEVCDGLEIVSPPRVDVRPEWRDGLGHTLIDDAAKACCAFQHTYKADPEVHLGELENRSEELLFWALMSLWIARPSGASIRVILRYRQPGEKKALGIGQYNASFHPNQSYEHDVIEQGDLDTLAIIAPRVESVFGSEGPLRVSLSLLLQALCTGFWDTRFVLFATVLESLFTTDNQEVAHKLSERVAWFLEDNGDARRRVFKSLKRLYGVRSRIIHGGSLTRRDIDESAQLLAGLETMVGRVLRMILRQDDLLSTFTHNREDRKKFVEDLLF